MLIVVLNRSEGCAEDSFKSYIRRDILVSLTLTPSIFSWFIPVYRPVHSAGLWLLWHHQGDRPQESHRPDPTARLHRGDPRKHRPKCKLVFAETWSPLRNEVGCWFFASCVRPYRSTLLQRTGCSNRPGVCSWHQKWWIVPQWSSSGVSRMRRDWSSSCAVRNSSGKSLSDGWSWTWPQCLQFLCNKTDQVAPYLTTRLRCWTCRCRVYDPGILSTQLFRWNF